MSQVAWYTVYTEYLIYNCQRLVDRKDWYVCLGFHLSSPFQNSRPPTSFSLKIANHSCRYSVPYLWNQLPELFREPHPHLSISASQSHFLGHADHRFHQYHHCHHLSALLSFTPDSKHTFSTNHFYYSLSIMDHPVGGLHGYPARSLVFFQLSTID